MRADSTVEHPVELSYAQTGRAMAFLLFTINQFEVPAHYYTAHEKLRDAALLEHAVIGDEIMEREAEELAGEEVHTMHLRLTDPELVACLDSCLLVADSFPDLARHPAAQQLKAKIELLLIDKAGLDLPLHITRSQLASALRAAVETQPNKEA